MSITACGLKQVDLLHKLKLLVLIIGLVVLTGLVSPITLQTEEATLV